MKQLIRPEKPQILHENAVQWGNEFAEKRSENSSFQFQWRQIGGKKVNEILREILSNQMTQHHCSYCDGGYPLGASAQQTIDHFRPKSRFPLRVYEWDNLFLCCNVCQNKKLEQFEEALLKPDEEDFKTNRYFMCNFKTGEIEANAHATPEDQVRAHVTIRILGLNDSPRPRARKRELQQWENTELTARFLDDFSYRFFLNP